MKLLAVSLFYFLTQHLYKTTRKKINYLCFTLIRAGSALKHIDLGRDWHYLFCTQTWSWKLMPNLPENPGSSFGRGATAKVICWCNEDIS